MATTFENVTVLHDTKPTFTFSNPRLLLQAAHDNALPAGIT
jgi:hypothetical protein